MNPYKLEDNIEFKNSWTLAIQLEVCQHQQAMFLVDDYYFLFCDSLSLVLIGPFFMFLILGFCCTKKENTCQCQSWTERL